MEDWTDGMGSFDRYQDHFVILIIPTKKRGKSLKGCIETFCLIYLYNNYIYIRHTDNDSIPSLLGAHPRVNRFIHIMKISFSVTRLRSLHF